LEERFIDPSKEMLLSAVDETTKASGYYKLSLGDGKLTRLLMDNFDFSSTIKSRNANQLLFTRESFREFPDVWTADFNFKAPRKISAANPQMKNYLWGSVEMVNWVSLDNIPLQGLLYKPEGFDPRNKYPMLVYFYEKNSDNIHNHYVLHPFGHPSILPCMPAMATWFLFLTSSTKSVRPERAPITASCPDNQPDGKRFCG